MYKYIYTYIYIYKYIYIYMYIVYTYKIITVERGVISQPMGLITIDVAILGSKSPLNPIDLSPLADFP